MVNTMYDIYKKAYLHHKVKYGADTAIFYQVGKFYEMYDWIDKTGETQTSMCRATEALGIQLTPKPGDGPGGVEGLFSGVPEQSLHKYARLLTQQGWTVVIYEQVKDSKGAVKSRVVTRILSPGTHVEAVDKDAVYFGAIWLEEELWGSKTERDPPSFALLATDLTTGRTMTYEAQAVGKKDSWTADGAFHFFQVHQPRECVVWWRGDALTKPSAEAIRRQFGLQGAIHFEQADSKSQGSLEIPQVREEFLARTISIRSLLPVRQACGLADRTERIVCAALQRIEEMYPSGLKHLHPPEKWNPATSLLLGNQALLQLNMITPRMEDSILGLFQKTNTSFGLRAIRNRLLYPIADSEILEKHYSEIQTALDWPLAIRETVVTTLRQIADLPRIHRKISAISPSPADILLLDQSYNCVKRLSTLMRGTVLEQSDNWDCEDIQNRFAAVFSVEKALSAGQDSFCFQPGRAPTVDAAEKRIVALREKLLATLETVRKWANIAEDSLKLEERELSGPILTGNRATMLTVANKLKTSATAAPFQGIQLCQKKSSAYLEIPILDSTFREIQKTRGELQDAIKKALPALCDELSDGCLRAWENMEEWVALQDVTVTIAQVSRHLGFCRPSLESGSAAAVQIKGLRHPLIEARATRVEYVKHDVSLEQNCRGWLVYGMNASGKSSLMKAVGISVLLAQAGCFVPCGSMSFVPFRSLFTRILNTDNLWAGLSSFAVEMTELREILQQAGEYSLVLGDELCSGTESVSATAIVASSLNRLHDRGAKFIFATHLHGLVDIPSVAALPSLKIWHLKVRYDPALDTLLYERTLTPGPGSSLYGLEVARAMNLPEDVLQMAHAIRRGLLGTVNEIEAPQSSWNSEICRRQCELCKVPILKELEVHHIRPRALQLPLGEQDHARNLVVVCAKCHDEIHAGTRVVAPLVQTDKGPQRLEADSDTVISSVSGSLQRSKWSAEQIQSIKEYLRKYPNSPAKRVIYDLQEKGISISTGSLRTFRQGLQQEQ